jgi:multimeric flavodoxin WrbA
MNIIAINGSPHPRGTTWKLLHQIKRKVPKLELLQLRDNVSGVTKAVRTADVVVFASPIRWFNVSALMKELLEELEEAPNFPLQDKIAYLIAIGDEDGGQQTINQMFAPLSHMGFWFPPYASQFVNTSMKGKSEEMWQDRVPESIAAELQRLKKVFDIIRGEGLVTLLNEERKKAACRKSSSNRSAPRVHRRGAEAAVRRR